MAFAAQTLVDMIRRLKYLPADHALRREFQTMLDTAFDLDASDEEGIEQLRVNAADLYERVKIEVPIDP